MDMTKGSIVLANAGRDQDGVFFVVGEADGFVLLADGKRRKLERPKRKNPVHVCPVLCEGFDRYAECFYGRSYADSPDIDGKIFFDAPKTTPLGEILKVKITDVLDGDLVGTIA